jgi:hypothetical protein
MIDPYPLNAQEFLLIISIFWKISRDISYFLGNDIFYLRMFSRYSALGNNALFKEKGGQDAEAQLAAFKFF